MLTVALATIATCGPYVHGSNAHVDLRSEYERQAAIEMAFSYVEKVRSAWKFTKWPKDSTLRIRSNSARFDQFLKSARAVSTAAGLNAMAVEHDWNVALIETAATEFQVKEFVELIKPIMGADTANFIVDLANDSGQCIVQTKHDQAGHVFGAVLVVFTDRVDDKDYERCASVLSMGLMGLLYPTRVDVESVMNLKFKARNAPTNFDLRVVHAVYDDRVKAGSAVKEFSHILARE